MIRTAHRFLLAASIAAGALVAMGCGRPFTPATPDGFIEFKDRYDNSTTHEYRASTADGVVMSVRSFKNDPKADMPLAVRALENRVRLGQGYALLDKKDVTARDGTKGTKLRFGHDEEGGAHLYYVTVFVTDDYVFLLEAGGKKDLVEAADASIDWSIQNFLPK
jgi:hypothetical protein